MVTIKVLAGDLARSALENGVRSAKDLGGEIPGWTVYVRIFLEDWIPSCGKAGVAACRCKVDNKEEHCDYSCCEEREAAPLEPIPGDENCGLVDRMPLSRAYCGKDSVWKVVRGSRES